MLWALLTLLADGAPLHAQGYMTTPTGATSSLSVSSSSPQPSTACMPVQPPCTPPANSIGVISRTTAADLRLDFGFPTEVGRCTCSGGLIDTFFEDSADPDPYTAPVNMWCIDMTDAPNTCVCTEDGQCYRTFGAVDFVFPTTFCDAGGCHAYVFVQCTVNADPNSGLTNAATGTVAFTCAQQGTFANPTLLGSNSPYFRARTFSCSGGCVDTTCPTCSGPFMAAFNHFALRRDEVVSTGVADCSQHHPQKSYWETKAADSVRRKGEF